MAPIIPTPPESGAAEDRDATSFLAVSKTLTLADTSETLFTVPVGFVARAVDLSVPVQPPSGGSAFVNLNGGAALVTSSKVPRGGAFSRDGIELPAGNYEFIGEAGKTPTVEGTISLSPAP